MTMTLPLHTYRFRLVLQVPFVDLLHVDSERCVMFVAKIGEFNYLS